MSSAELTARLRETMPQYLRGLLSSDDVESDLNEAADELDRLSAEQAEARAEAAEARAARLEAAMRGHWHGVFLDGRNEYGSHVLMLPQRSIELDQDQDSNGDFLKSYAETILAAAEAMGFTVGDAVVATFYPCWDDGFFSHYEFADVSADLTAAFYGTPDEQSIARAALDVKEAG